MRRALTIAGVILALIAMPFILVAMLANASGERR
jgi:hypothetical protein